MKSVRKSFAKVDKREQTNIHKHVDKYMFKARKTIRSVG